MRLASLLCIALATTMLVGCGHPGGARGKPPVAIPNDNRQAAGSRSGDTVTLRLVVQLAEWRPASDSGPGIPIAAFAEEGGAPRNPGPLLRVPLGSHISLSMRNTLSDTLAFCAPFANVCAPLDTLRILPGATVTRNFLADRIGNFLYGAYTLRGDTLHDRVLHHQLAGALVVDSAGATVGNDRIFVITSWQKTVDEDSPFVQGINGRTWPHTESFDVPVGDSLHWRWLNATDTPHPMHLHGFYFRLLSRGDGERDTTFAPADQMLEVTEELLGSATIAWSPSRAGNWLFHCHKTAHMSYVQQAYLSGVAPPDTMEEHSAAEHAARSMGGLILGVHAVTPAGGSTDPIPGVTVPPPRRDRVRLAIHERARFYRNSEAALGFVLEPAGTQVPRDSLTVPGPLLLFNRGIPAEIAILNRLRTPTTVHWHGIELESYYDGVAGWSGTPGSLTPFIAPGDSFVARFTPPRSGTFMYHAHTAEERQIGTGMLGPIVVHDEGATWNARTDHILMFSQAGRSDSATVAVNGLYPPDTVVLQRDRPNRLRLINITLMDDVQMQFGGKNSAPTWRMVAKDGADLPRSLARRTQRRVLFGPGEIVDMVVEPFHGAATLHIDTYNNFDIVLVWR